MQLNSKKNILYIVLLLLSIISALDVFIDEEDPNRYIAVIFQGLLLGISLLFMIISYVRNRITPLHNYLLVFISMLVIYGILTPNIEKLPILLYPLLFFYLAYYISSKELLQLKHIQLFAIILFILSVYNTYLGIFERADKLGDFFRKADNVGYTSLSLMLLFTMDLKRIRNIIFLSLSFILVILSFKRGAMIIGAFVYFIAMWPIFSNRINIKKQTKSILIFSSIVVVLGLIYFSFQYWDIISYRFIKDETGGSGRELFWSEIVKGWENAGMIRQFFGFGLFKVPEFLGTSLYGSAVYAHSDWYELLYDHGIFGITIYLAFLLKLISLRKLVFKHANDYYYPYLSVIIAWLLKSYFAGVYINKVTIFSMLIIAFILSQAYKNKMNITKVRS
jgi:hypothetical protein